jgi:DNA-binding response OmpR family regulator
VKILIIEDDRSLSRSISDYMKMEGHICETAEDLKLARMKIADNRYDCIIVDIGLPDGSGLEVIKDLKDNKVSDGVLILSARSSLDDKLTGLKIGADDYLTKPFHFAELSARINSIYRRNNLSGMNEVSFNEISINISDSLAYVNGTLDRKSVV